MSTNEMAEQTKARKEKPLNEYVIALLWLIVMVSNRAIAICKLRLARKGSVA